MCRTLQYKYKFLRSSAMSPTVVCTKIYCKPVQMFRFAQKTFSRPPNIFVQTSTNVLLCNDKSYEKFHEKCFEPWKTFFSPKKDNTRNFNFVVKTISRPRNRLIRNLSEKSRIDKKYKSITICRKNHF